MHNTTTRPGAAAAATTTAAENLTPKVKRARKPVIGHVIKFTITDEAEYTKLTALAHDDSRSADNFALLLVRKHLKPATGAAS